ncbi:MAG: hypothetical protein CK529_10385 [Rhodospirillaceae bacterium]|nr:MAG: hypothetical protein CK529_10385 [Rhodospirillaceae bacterium]
MQLPPKSAAVIASVLFASTLGVLIVVASFGFMRLMEQMGEGLGITPPRWAENNPDTLLAISAISAIPVVIWFVIWFYKKAVTAENNLKDYRYSPPEPQKHAGKL